ncbi:MAG TPA: GNAT family N-acetyltransferase [Terriglobales bacterium]|nr:GNAT family N-acetyltransferase [Terriglobales bacterium]
MNPARWAGSVAVYYRPPRRAELADCALVWYSAVDDYMGRLGRPLPSPYLDPLMALFDHLLTTDPERFLVAVRRPTPGSSHAREQVVGFGIAAQRENVWFLSQLYVLPSEQRHGIGHALLSQILPSLPGLPPSDSGSGAGETTAAVTAPDLAPQEIPGSAPGLPLGVLATCTDSAQPASSGLYARYGMVPRMPVFNLVGTPKTPSVLAPLPSGIEAIAFSRTDPSSPIDAIDREVLGFAHPLDHRHLRASGRTGFLYTTSGGEPLGYGYSSEAGRFGPVALLDEHLIAPVIGHLIAAIKPRGATSAWVPGANDRAIVALLRAGLRIEGFPALLGWTRPFGAFDRYLPASLALL